MLTKEGADADEIIVRPNDGNGWIVEVPRPGGVSVAYAGTQEQALGLARKLDAHGRIRILPAHDAGYRYPVKEPAGK